MKKREINICREFINEKSIILDIGANIGLHSIEFAKIAHKGKVFCFEPQIDCFLLMLKNIKKYPNIIPLNIAIDLSLKLSKFYIAEDNAYSSLKDTYRKKNN